MSHYNINQINIGDEISYEDKYRSNRNPNWKVIGKLDQTLLIIESTNFGSNEQRVIDVADAQKFVIHSKKEAAE